MADSCKKQNTDNTHLCYSESDLTQENMDTIKGFGIMEISKWLQKLIVLKILGMLGHLVICLAMQLLFLLTAYCLFKRENKPHLEPPHDKTNKMTYVPSEDSNQPGHPPNLIRVFTVRMKKPWVLSYPLSAQRRLLSDWVDTQADLSLCWVHSHFVGFVMRQLIS